MSEARWTVVALIGLALGWPLGVARAQGNVTFWSDTPAVLQGPGVGVPTKPASTRAISSPAAPAGTPPGIGRAILAPVTPEESAQAIESRPIADGLNLPVPTPAPAIGSATMQGRLSVSGQEAAVGPASIAELARALRNDPDLIYEYVRNNIDYYPVWGVHKGALGAVIDNRGTAFDPHRGLHPGRQPDRHPQQLDHLRLQPGHLSAGKSADGGAG